MADTGHGATLTFGTTGFTLNRRMIGGSEFELPDVNKSHLGTTGFEEYMPGDLEEPGEFEAECEFTPGAAGSIPARGTVETITQTYPIATGQSAGGTLAGTGYIKKVGTPELRTNTLMVVKVTVKWDGVTGPTFTPGS